MSSWFTDAIDRAVEWAGGGSTSADTHPMGGDQKPNVWQRNAHLQAQNAKPSPEQEGADRVAAAERKRLSNATGNEAEKKSKYFATPGADKKYEDPHADKNYALPEGAQKYFDAASGYLDRSGGMFNAASGLFTEAAGYSRKAWDTFTTFGKPALEGMARDYNPDNAAAQIAQEGGMAAADVSQSYATAEADMRRTLGRYGLQPGSGKFASALSSLARGRAADTAGARTKSRVGVIDRMRAGRDRLAQMATGVGMAGLQGLATAGQGMTAAAGGLAGVGQAQAGLAGMVSGYDLSRRGMAADYDMGRRSLESDYDLGRRSIDAGLEGARIAAREQRRSSNMGGFLGALGLGIGLFSDRRVKRNVIELGELEFGLKVYEFNYIDDPDTWYTGLMADEVFEVMPHNVFAVNGILAVDYGGVFHDLARVS